jgi:signal transduction histidine kinase
MSHELRTPLNAIIGFSELMREKMFGPLGDPRYTEYAGLIHNSGRHLLDLITDMLDMAKIEAGKMVLTPERVELGETLDDCLHTLQAQATGAGITLSSDVTGHPVLLADRRAVKQILLNLLSNALKFTTSGGQVVVSAWKAGGHGYIAVRDTGIGIAEEDLKRLGNPFEQARVNPMHAQGGTGLGLALVKALVEKHGGQCVMESQLGIGTTVIVDFPLAPKVKAIAKAS